MGLRFGLLRVERGELDGADSFQKRRGTGQLSGRVMITGIRVGVVGVVEVEIEGADAF